MFESNNYQEKRAALNEILLQQLASIVLSQADPTTKMQMQVVLEQYGKGQQVLRNNEAERILGPTVFAPDTNYASAQTLLDYLKANVGRTYFGTQDQTGAPEGSIGTAGYPLKFKEWLRELPAYDTALSQDIVSGFYRDEMTIGPSLPLPLLLLRNGDEIIVVLFRTYVSVMTLNLARVPADYRWNSKNHYALRGEMYTYRNDLSVEQLETELTKALAAQGIDTLHVPPVQEEKIETTGLVQIEEYSSETKERVDAASVTEEPNLDSEPKRGENSAFICFDDCGYTDVKQDASQAEAVDNTSTGNDTSTPSAD